jgi:hypothetical protein
MPKIQRASDVIEQDAEKAFYFIGGGIASAAVAGLLLKYQGSGGFVPLAWILVLAAVCLIGYGVYWIVKAKKVTSVSIKCPFCFERNDLVEQPVDDDVPCVACNRMIPIQGGQVLSVSQVRCGFCNGLNYYSAKTEALLCEHCNREIAKGFAVIDDDQQYELVLLEVGRSSEEVITTLQQMLALNRNQVKDILENTPVTLLQGLPRMKVDLLVAQLAAHGATAEARSLQ